MCLRDEDPQGVKTTKPDLVKVGLRRGEWMDGVPEAPGGACSASGGQETPTIVGQASRSLRPKQKRPLA